MALTAAPAGAAQVPVFNTFGSAEQPHFDFNRNLTVDQSNGDVLVENGQFGGSIRRYKPDGTPDNFSALGTNAIDAQGPGDGTPQGELNFNQAVSGELQIAVDNSGTATDGDIYVVQAQFALVDIFSSAGNYLGQLTAAGATSFSGVHGVAVDSKGNVYVGDYGGVHKFDPAGNPPVNADNVANFSGNSHNLAAGAGPTAGYIFVAGEGLEKRNATTGKLAYTLDTDVQNVAVDPVSGRVYALVNAAGVQEVRTYDASGAAPSLVSSVPNTSFGGLEGIAVDGSTGTPYVSRSLIGHVESIEYVTVPDVTTGTASPGLSSTTFDGTVNSAGVEPAEAFTDCHFEYVTEAAYEAHKAQGGFTDLSSGGSVPCESSDGNPITGPGEIPEDSGDHLVASTLTGLTPSTAYRFRLVAANSNGENHGDAVHFSTPGPPSIERAFVKDVTSTSAVLGAEANPHLLPTTYRFEYVDDATFQADVASAGPGHGFDHATILPPGGGDLGAGEDPLTVSTQLTGLLPGATYHSRFEIENSSGSQTSPDHPFTTQGGLGLGFQLADNRAWELVSPPNKHGGGLLFPPEGVIQAAADGSGIAYQSAGSIEADPEGNRAIEDATILSRRAAGGSWGSEDVTSPHSEATPLRFSPEFKTFSPNLEKAVFEQTDGTLLSPEASEQTAYLRGNTTPPTYTPLVTGKEGFANVPEGTVFGGGNGSGRALIELAAANASLTHVVLNSIPPLLSGAAPASLYEWAAGRLQPVSELPVSEGGGVVRGEGGSGFGSVQNAVSEDGSRVFWGGGGSYPGLSALYVRDTANEETGRLDLKQPGASGNGPANPAFQGASADGSVAFFSDQQQLTADASAPEPVHQTADLYRCEVAPVAGTLGCAGLTDISAPREGSGERAEFLGTVPGLSEDGSRIYFVAKGVLDTAPNEAGDTAVPGQPNLYLWQQGQGRRFIATLSASDESGWGLGLNSGDREGHAARVSMAGSPNGRYLSFMSERSLTGYDNRDALSGEADEEVFRYDAQSDRLECVSCNPSGASPDGVESDPGGNSSIWTDPHGLWSQRWVAATVPEATESKTTDGRVFNRPRAAHDDGRVFFNAIDSLVPADSNGQWDVYQWEPVGTGDCTASSGGAATVRSGSGCVSLVSSGTAEEEAAFLDASEGGNDVFFLTPAQLNETDQDHEADVYDARVDGIPGRLPKIAECLGEACQPAAQSPNDATPASAAFKGQGNVKSTPRKRCAKGKRAVRRKGRTHCVQRHTRKQRKHHRAHANRRAHR
ncbi:MAG TPA: hypothetical protein VFI09_09710 [Solirubrobacterales bacterium]|nr:hypothetical protein [Solirubrobacterales bacterium]